MCQAKPRCALWDDLSTKRSIFFLFRVIVRTFRGYWVRSKSEVHTRRDCPAGPGGCETFENAKRETDTDAGIPNRAGRRDASCIQNCGVKAALLVRSTSRCPAPDTFREIPELSPKCVVFDEKSSRSRRPGMRTQTATGQASR